MAAFIEDVLFGMESSLGEGDPRVFAQEMSRCIRTNGDACVYSHNLQAFEINRALTLEKNEYVVRVSVGREGRSLAVRVSEARRKCNVRVLSRQRQILTVKELARSQYDKAHESFYYLKNGDVVMAFRILLKSTEVCRRQMLDFYAQMINKNVQSFHRLMVRLALSFEGESMGQFEEDLFLTQAISTTSGYFDVSEEKSQFKTAQDTLVKQLQGLKSVVEGICVESALERQYQHLFQMVKVQNSSSWLQGHLLDSFSALYRKGKKLLALNKQGDRKIQDFLFNIIKVQIKDKIPNPIGQGGSSYIYLAKAMLTYINSVDFTSYKKKDEKSQRLVVIKCLKPELQRKLQAKLTHEKEIVSKLKGSCSMFIPKYYGTEKDSDLSNVLLMEHIHGIELDRYLNERYMTVSLWTKICILINIVHGLRHLVSYDIVHLDIKPINIILCRNLITKVLDFGEAYHKDVCPKDYCPGYTYPYAAPETFKMYQAQRLGLPYGDFNFTEKQDVFSFGMLMYQMLFTKSLFNMSAMRWRQIFSDTILQDRMFFAFESLSAFGDDAIISTLLLITFRCLSPEPQSRPKFDWIGVSLKLILNSYISH